VNDVNDATRSRPNPGLLGLVLFFAALLLVGVVPRVRARFERERDAQARAEVLPRVAITRAKPAPPSDLSLPGSALPLQQATIYARVNGYLERRLVDIGDAVKAGQLLAVISAPELDQQLAQAQAELARSKADLEYARSTLERYESADREGAVANTRGRVCSPEPTARARSAAREGACAPPGSVEPYFLPLNFSSASKMGRKMSVS